MAVVLGQPEAVVTERVGALCQRQGVADRLALRPAGGGDRLVEDGNSHGRLSWRRRASVPRMHRNDVSTRSSGRYPRVTHRRRARQERRRVGKGWVSQVRSRVATYHKKKKNK